MILAPITLTITLTLDPAAIAELERQCAEGGCMLAQFVLEAIRDAEMQQGAGHDERDA